MDLTAILTLTTISICNDKMQSSLRDTRSFSTSFSSVHRW